jgi:pyrroline-5-carboxylate reductase
MASAIFKGAYEKGASFHAHFYTPSGTRAKSLADSVKGEVLADLSQIPSADCYFIGCKPQQFNELSSKLKGKLAKDACVVSIMAAIDTGHIEQSLGVESVIRVMPNTPSLLGHGMNTMFSTSSCADEHVGYISSFFSKIGLLTQLSSESLLDDITPVNGSAPSYFFEIARALELDLVKLGVAKEEASLIVAQTMKGSAEMLLQTKKDASVLKDEVTSEGGVSMAALAVMNEHDLVAILHKALARARARNNELMEQFNA